MSISFADDREFEIEESRRKHIAKEGDGMANEHPDGCYNCGSPHHHTTDCREEE